MRPMWFVIDESLGGELARVAVAVPAVAGRRAGVIVPDFLVSGKVW